MWLLAVFLEMCKNRKGGGGREKRNKIDGVFRLENYFQYLSSNSLKVQSIEPSSVDFLTSVINYLWMCQSRQGLVGVIMLT